MQGCPRELSNPSWIKLSRLALVRLQLTFFKLRTTHKEWRIFFFFIYVTKIISEGIFFVELEVAVDVWKVNYYFFSCFFFVLYK